MESTESDASAENEKFTKYLNAVRENPADFTSWTCLLQTVDQENILEKGREVYEEFFSSYPYCYGYWKKYADLEKKNGNLELSEKVFQAGVKAIPLSIDLWMHYLNFMAQFVKDKEDSTETMRDLFERAINAAGMEFRSDKLWDAYIDWEKSQGNLRNVIKLYDQLLSTPTQQYIKHFTKFKEWINNSQPSDVLTTEEYIKLVGEVESIPPGVSQTDKASADMIQATAPPGEEATLPPGESSEANDDLNSNDESNKDEHSYTVDDDDDESDGTKEKEEESEIKAVRKRIISIREEIFHRTEENVKKRWHFEDAIKRPYFHVKPLEKMQLRNWKDYLDFEIRENDHQRIFVLFERCLIACALYEEFWQKYISYLENCDEENRNELVHHAYKRACKIHLTKKPNIILNWAAFEESQDNIEGARNILQCLEDTVPGLIMVTLRRAGLERRAGYTEKGIEVLKEEMEQTHSLDEKSFLAIKISRYYAKFLNDKGSARATLQNAIENDKGNKKLYLNLLDLEMESSNISESNLQELCNLVENCEELSTEFKQGIRQRHLEILEDFGSDINGIIKAYESYQKQFKIKPGTVVTKKRSNSNSTDTNMAKVSKMDEPESSSNALQNNTYHNHGYPAQDTSLQSSVNSYAYPAVANQWGAYTAAAQNAGSYYGWYNPYGTYPQQPAL